jgi:DHA1 family bicyclomycin/chloramphenicol resistance-like MFS transporter
MIEKSVNMLNDSVVVHTQSNEYYIRLLLFIIPFLMGCGVDLYIPSLPAIVSQFNVPNNLVQMTIAMYMLGYGMGQAVLGVLSDLFGRKSILICSAVLYTMISFLIAIYSPTILYLITYRFIQGLAIGGMAVVCRAIAADCYRGLELSKKLTLISIGFGLGPIIGPMIGAYLQYYFNWQAAFYFFGGYGLIILLFALFKLPETIVNCHELHFSKIFKNIININFNATFLTCTLWGALAYSFLVVFTAVSPFLIQDTLHYSVINYGKIILLLGFGYFGGTIFNRFLLNYFSPMANTCYGLMGMFICSVCLLTLTWLLAFSVMTLIIPIWLIFFFSGLVFPNSMTKSLDLFPHSAGTVSALFGTWLGIVVFIMTTLTGLLKINSQQNLAIMFIVMLVMSFLLFITGICLEKKKKWA